MQSRSRTGFTLVELMVAMALTMFVMVILSQAFVLSLETFSNMTGIGTMMTNLRTFEVILRDDLSQDHFEGKRRLSDVNAAGAGYIALQPPQAGFFAVRQSSAVSAAAGAAYAAEGNDANNLPSFRAVDHYLYFTVKRKGNRQENFFTAALQGQAAVLDAFFSKQSAYSMLPTQNLNLATPDLPNSTQTMSHQIGAGRTNAFYSSQWAEVMYYLVRTGSTEEPNNPASIIGTPTYALYRAQFVMVPNGDELANQFLNAGGLQFNTFTGMSCNPGATTLEFYSPSDATQNPQKRVVPDLAAFNLGNLATFNRFAGAQTLVAPNVISFHVQVMQVGAGNTSFGDVTLYDTARFNSAGYVTNGLKAIQATLRVWDNKTRQTRQLTVVQDL